MESSLLLHIVGDRGLSRGGSVVRRFPVQDVDELRCSTKDSSGRTAQEVTV